MADSMNLYKTGANLHISNKSTPVLIRSNFIGFQGAGELKLGGHGDRVSRKAGRISYFLHIVFLY